MTEGQARLIRVLRDRVQSLFDEGKIDEAFKIAETAVESARRNGKDDKEFAPDVFGVFFHIAELRKKSGDGDAADKLYDEALEVSKREGVVIPPADLGAMKHSYAMYCDQNDQEEKAVELYTEAIELYKSLNPEPKVDIANMANNLGMLYRNQTKLDLAERCYDVALQAFEQLNGPDHLTVATVCNNLGGLYWAWRHPEMARDMHLRALKIRRELLSDDHPDIGQSACNLATVYHDLGDFDKASRNYERALGILGKNLADNAETYEIVTQNFADLMKEHGQEGKAKKLLAKTERMLEKVKAKA